MLNRNVSLLAAAVWFYSLAPLAAADVVVTTPDYPRVNATAIDQPELYALATDGGEVITDQGRPVVFEAFIDTGASGFVISYITATGEYDTLSLGLGPADIIGEFTETGIAGQETGDVTRKLGVSVSNVTPGTAGSIELDEFQDYGLYNLWVRRQAGTGEAIDLGIAGAIVDPMNVIGMPVISQRTMVMTPPPVETIGRMETQLLPDGDPAIPQGNITLEMQLVDLVGEPTPSEVPPSFAMNPMLPGVTIATGTGQDRQVSAGNTWLFDTGSGSTIISFEEAQSVGLIDPGYADLGQFMAEYDGPKSIIGGIGSGELTVPILQLDEIRVPAREGFDVVWNNVDVLVSDVAGLDGVFGMNMLLPSATIDAGALGLEGMGDLDNILQELRKLLDELFGGAGGLSVPLDATSGLSLDDLLSLLELDISPVLFDSMVFDVTGQDTAELHLYNSQVPEPTSLLLLAAGGAVLLRHRKRS